MSRSLWKLNFLHPQVALAQVTQSSENIVLNEINVQNRATQITSAMQGRRFQVYNGTRWFPLEITPERVGHRVGEFAPTRKHSSPKKKKAIKK